jgi:ribosomal subunit interface protein
MKDYVFSASEKLQLDSAKLRKYCDKRIGKLEKYVPRKARESSDWSVRFTLADDKRNKTCTVKLALPHETLVVTESAEHAYSALDIAVLDMKRKIQDYKTKHDTHGLRHRLARSLRKSR